VDYKSDNVLFACSNKRPYLGRLGSRLVEVFCGSDGFALVQLGLQLGGNGESFGGHGFRLVVRPNKYGYAMNVVNDSVVLVVVAASP
jgi:hypothetical protein